MKLLFMGILITLASLAHVAPGIASMYVFPGGNATIESWTEIYGVGQDHKRFTVNIVYDTLNIERNLRLSVDLSGSPAVVSAIDLELITTAEYRPAREGWLSSRNWGEILYEFSLNRGNTSFSFAATLTEVEGDSNYYDIMTSFSFSRSYADPSASSVPLPGAVWLLGSGLMGLACLKTCLRK